MAFLQRLTNLFSRGGRDENRLQKAMEHAHAKRPAEAIALYDSIVNDKRASSTARSRALFNRSLAYSSLKDDARAISDLEEVITQPAVPENVLTAARNQLLRVRQRVERRRDRFEARASDQAVR